MSPALDVDRLQALFASGELLRPDAGLPNTVMLARALAYIAGAPRFDDESGMDGLVSLIGDARHIVFVLADGLGVNLVERLPPDSFLRGHMAATLRAVFPSSTAPSLTSLATGVWPASHAVPGWFTYLAEVGLTGVLLPFADRATHRNLLACGASPDLVFPLAPQAPYFHRDFRAFHPRQIAESVYTRYVNGRKASGHAELELGISGIIRRLKEARRPTYSYLYIPDVDQQEHEHGVESDEAWQQVLRVDRELARLGAASGDETRMVLSADHGQVTVPDSEKHLLTDADELASLLRVWPPSGEPRATSFHVREGLRDSFVRAFRARFGDAFLLLSADEAESLSLFGPAIFSPVTRARVGDFVAIPAGRGAITYAGEPSVHALKGMHGGLMPDEMSVPLIVA